MSPSKETPSDATVPPREEDSRPRQDAELDNDKPDVTRKRKQEQSTSTSRKTHKKCKATAKNSPKPRELLPGRYVRHVLVPKVQGDILSFKGSRQFFCAARDALNGLNALHRETDIIHGSIAPKHITINKDGTGVLVDWDIPGVEIVPPGNTSTPRAVSPFREYTLDDVLRNK